MVSSTEYGLPGCSIPTYSPCLFSGGLSPPPPSEQASSSPPLGATCPLEGQRLGWYLCRCMQRIENKCWSFEPPRVCKSQPCHWNTQGLGRGGESTLKVWNGSMGSKIGAGWTLGYCGMVLVWEDWHRGGLEQQRSWLFPHCPPPLSIHLQNGLARSCSTLVSTPRDTSIRGESGSDTTVIPLLPASVALAWKNWLVPHGWEPADGAGWTSSPPPPS